MPPRGVQMTGGRSAADAGLDNPAGDSSVDGASSDRGLPSGDAAVLSPAERAPSKEGIAPRGVRDADDASDGGVCDSDSLGGRAVFFFPRGARKDAAGTRGGVLDRGATTGPTSARGLARPSGGAMLRRPAPTLPT